MAIKTLDTMATVLEDRTVTLQLPPEVTPGPHRIIAIIEDTTPGETQRSSKEFVFPVIEEAEWPADVSLRREDMYGDDGR